MKPTWHRVSTTIFGDSHHGPGTASLFFDFDLANWTFGLRADVDDSWVDLVIQIGPIAFSLIYWRVWPAPNEKSPPAGEG